MYLTMESWGQKILLIFKEGNKRFQLWLINAKLLSPFIHFFDIIISFFCTVLWNDTSCKSGLGLCYSLLTLMQLPFPTQFWIKAWCFVCPIQCMPHLLCHHLSLSCSPSLFFFLKKASPSSFLNNDCFYFSSYNNKNLTQSFPYKNICPLVPLNHNSAWVTTDSRLLP